MLCPQRLASHRKRGAVDARRDCMYTEDRPPWPLPFCALVRYKSAKYLSARDLVVLHINVVRRHAAASRIAAFARSDFASGSLARSGFARDSLARCSRTCCRRTLYRLTYSSFSLAVASCLRNPRCADIRMPWVVHRLSLIAATTAFNAPALAPARSQPAISMGVENMCAYSIYKHTPQRLSTVALLLPSPGAHAAAPAPRSPLAGSASTRSRASSTIRSTWPPNMTSTGCVRQS